MLNRLCKRLFRIALLLLSSFVFASASQAATCSYATSQGSTGPADWQTYCWLDFTGYNDTTARSAGGQAFSYTLSDGTVMTFTLKVSGSALTGATSPSWSGAAVGNTAFLGIGGRPILYQTAAGTSIITISSITLTPPSSGTITNYMLVAGDGESSNQGESLQFVTNAGNWQMLDQAGPISGSSYPTYTGVGTSTFTETGALGNVGAYIVGSANPTQLTTTLVGGGLQGVMLAVRFASIRLNTQISGARADPTDQFSFAIKATSNGATLASGSTSGTGLGPFSAAALSSSAAVPLTLSQAMSGGSTNTIAHYRSVLSCTNDVSSTTMLPSNLVTTTYSFGSLQFGDSVSCSFTETPFPHLTLTKTLGAGGRQFASDQFIMTLAQGTTVVATATTTGSGTTVSTGSTPPYQATAGTAYSFNEMGAGSTSLIQYSATMTCVNAATGSSTALPSTPGGTVSPQMGDVITCTILNTKRAANATITVTKTSAPDSDPVNGTASPKAIPGAVMLYSITVANTGASTIDNNSVFIVDSLPTQISVGTAASPTFTQGSPTSGLSFSSGTDIRYSNSSTAPSSFAACTYSPASAYDNSVRFVCFNPKGTMAGSTGSPPNFTISFRAQIK